MTDTRQVLEEAWEHLCQTSLSFRRYACTTIPGGDGWTMTGKFCRFLDAEAWTDAALMLIGDDLPWGIMKNPKSKQIEAGVSAKPNGDGVYAVVADHPALAIAQAALRAKEAGDA